MPARRRKTSDNTTVKATGITLTPLGEDGAPRLADRRILPDTNVTIELSPEVPEYFEAPAPIRSVSYDVDASNVSPETVRTLKALTRIPIPTAVIDRWFPAFVRWPGEDMVLNLCKVFLTPQGLYVYKKRPTEPETFTDGAQPDRYAVVLWDETVKPVTGTTARNAGIPIMTSVGKVIVQPSGGCGCGSRMKHWLPDWSRNRITWETALTLPSVPAEGR